MEVLRKVKNTTTSSSSLTSQSGSSDSSIRRGFLALPSLASSRLRSRSSFWNSSNSSTDLATIWFTVSSSGTSFSSYEHTCRINKLIITKFSKDLPLHRHHLDVKLFARTAAVLTQWIFDRTYQPE